MPLYAVGGTSIAAHEAALRRVEQAGAKLISTVQLFCELQRDWKRSETVPAFMSLFIERAARLGSSSPTAQRIRMIQAATANQLVTAWDDRAS